MTKNASGVYTDCIDCSIDPQMYTCWEGESFDTTLKAAEVVKRVDGLNDEQIEEWKVNTTNYREALKENQFPAEMWEITTQTLDNSKEGHTK